LHRRSSSQWKGKEENKKEPKLGDEKGKKERERKKSVTSAEFTAARHVVKCASHGRSTLVSFLVLACVYIVTQLSPRNSPLMERWSNDRERNTVGGGD